MYARYDPEHLQPNFHFTSFKLLPTTLPVTSTLR